MREFCTSGSVGAAGGQPPAATRANDSLLRFGRLGLARLFGLRRARGCLGLRGRRRGRSRRIGGLRFRCWRSGLTLSGLGGFSLLLGQGEPCAAKVPQDDPSWLQIPSARGPCQDSTRDRPSSVRFRVDRGSRSPSRWMRGAPQPSGTGSRFHVHLRRTAASTQSLFSVGSITTTGVSLTRVAPDLLVRTGFVASTAPNCAWRRWRPRARHPRSQTKERRLRLPRRPTTRSIVDAPRTTSLQAITHFGAEWVWANAPCFDAGIRASARSI